MGNPEILTPNEATVDIGDTAAERSKEISKKLENSVESSPDKQQEQVKEARAEANKEALMSRESGGAETKQASQGLAPAHASKKQRSNSYENTMDHIRSEMRGPARTFSKIIHNSSVEKVSEVVGSTIARPNAIVAGSTAAMIMTLAVFIVAKRYGYQLSGFETIGSFTVGWILGVIYDYIRIGFAGKRH